MHHNGGNSSQEIGAKGNILVREAGHQSPYPVYYISN